MQTLKHKIVLNMAAAAAYLVAGWFGTLLATPPSNASPIWPAAGVALALMLVYGEIVLPGIFLGALFAQFYAFLELSSPAKLLESAWVGSLVAIGCCAQAWLGMWLVNRYVGRHDPLIEDKKILRFFFLIAASCLVSATVGVTYLTFRGVIGLSNVASSWATWWVGDTIGAVVFAPMSLIFIGRPRPLWRARRNFVLLPLLIVILLVVAAFELSMRQEHQRLASQFQRQVDLLHATIQEHLHDHLATNSALKALFDSSKQVDRENFKLFAESIHDRRSSILEWTPRVAGAERADWESRHQAMIRELTGEGGLEPARPKAEYFPVTFLVPLSGNEMALGFDISSNPKVAPQIFQSLESGNTLATGPIRLVQDNVGRQGVVIYSPVYRSKALQTPQARKHAFLGFVAGVFRIDLDIQLIFEKLGDRELQLLLTIHDGDELIYSNLPADFHRTLQFSDLGLSQQIDFAGRQWRVDYLPAANFFDQQQSLRFNWLILGGFLLCGLTGFGLLLLTGRTARVEEIVEKRTEDLLRSNEALNQEIAIRRRQEHELRVAATTFESHEAIAVTDAAGTILRVNRAFSEITGYSAAEAVGQNPRLLSSGYHDHEFYRQMYKQLSKNNQWKGEIWNRRKNGTVFPELLTVTGVRDEQNQLTHYVAIFSDVSDKKAAEQEIHNLAFYDPLTNLPNRRLLLDRLQQEIAAAKRQLRYGALFFLDLDHFKKLNDSRGHQVGDELLIQVARRLQSIIREEDTACRLGGDEFIVMVPGRFLSLQQATNHAAMLAEKILLAINHPFEVQGSEHHFSTSIGVTLYPETADQPEDIIQQADTAMYRAKESGRNSISFFKPAMQAAADRRLTLEKEMRRALQEQQFVLHYQPQVNDEPRVVSAEALIRWQHPEKGMISPAEFIPLAEDTHLILPIGAWVLHETCRQIKAWDEQGHKIDHVAVNVSSRQFRQAGFVQQVRQALLDTGVNAKRLVIELTEGCVIEHIDDTIAKMHALQAMGVRISIDDFGVGYSSLSYLKSLPLSQLKIDQSFVRHINDPNAAVIVETIIMMTKSLGLNVIAEGVEEQAQIDFLKAKGCSFYQGYYYGRPVPADAFKFSL
ncbi:EAL domain-containing protein [Methylomonas sp. SURF-2]|uniref:EAL domain-containing protein n=1 Tax=Methylomonas subterranea TaxID=2952225 RepID=A0ABT1TI28_9GAMM|nr:EAL domain-containing protein [Methylomonas sp. SURF-2]MCQ8104964.1 EAL domain-containing protein [Methylomonas sp. SURF-2]